MNKGDEKRMREVIEDILTDTDSDDALNECGYVMRRFVDYVCSEYALDHDLTYEGGNE